MSCVKEGRKRKVSHLTSAQFCCVIAELIVWSFKNFKIFIKGKHYNYYIWVLLPWMIDWLGLWGTSVLFAPSHIYQEFYNLDADLNNIYK